MKDYTRNDYLFPFTIKESSAIDVCKVRNDVPYLSRVSNLPKITFLLYGHIQTQHSNTKATSH